MASIKPSVKRISREEYFPGLVTLVQNDVSRLTAIDVVPKFSLRIEVSRRGLIRAEIVQQFLVCKWRRAEEIGCFADASDVEDRSRSIRTRSFKRCLRGSRI